MSRHCPYCGNTVSPKDKYGYCKTDRCLSRSGVKDHIERLDKRIRNSRFSKIPTYRRNSFDGVTISNPREEHIAKLESARRKSIQEGKPIHPVNLYYNEMTYGIRKS